MIVSRKEYTPLTFNKIQLSEAETKVVSTLFQDFKKKPELIDGELDNVLPVKTLGGNN